jgi:uncharacterized protein YggE
MKTVLGSAMMVAAMASPAMANAEVTQTVISGTRLDITARGDVHRIPDIAVISAGVTTNAADAANAMQDNANRMSRVLAALKKAGVAAKDVSTSSINLAPQYRYVENQAPVIVGYQASNQVTVRFRDIAKSGTILDALVKEGSNQINGPMLTIDKPEAAQDEARIAAIKAARARANLYAAALGMKIVRVVSISESEGYSGGPVPVMAMRSMDAAAEKTEIMPGEQSVTVNVSVVFELQ